MKQTYPLRESDAKSSHFIMALVICLLLAATSPSNADDGATLEKKRASEAYALIAKRIDDLKIVFADGDRETLERQPRSLLRWSNPVIGSVYGEVFVWTHKGRPHVIVSSFRFYSPIQTCSFEFQSLSTRKLTATFRDQVAWSPQESGVTWKTIEGVKGPTARKSLRLLQMKSLAKTFSATTLDRKDETIERRMNLQTTPLFRYGNDNDILDGAIFGLALGTDPEIALLIEAVKSEAGMQWRYAFARQNSVAMKGMHKGRVVWDKPKLAPPWPQARDPAKPYMLFSLPLTDAATADASSKTE